MKTKPYFLFPRLLMVIFLSSMTFTLGAQTFSSTPNNVLSINTVAPMDVHLADLDEDGDLDIIYSYANGVFSWIENLDGLGNYGTPQVFANMGYFMGDIHSGDVDSDGDIDIIAVTSFDVLGLSWFENLDCLGTFSSAQVVSDGQYNVQTNCFPADIDGDGNLDIVSNFNNSAIGNKIAWYRNTDGLGTFGPPQTIHTFSPGGLSNIFGDLHAADIDGDGDLDVLAASYISNQIDWYENDGLGSFGSPQSVATSVFGMGTGSNLYAVDLDGDEDMDVLSSTNNERITWYENIDGLGSYGPEQLIHTFNVNDLSETYPADVDGDGDMDIVSVQNYSISWFENIDCAGSFSQEQIIVPYAQGSNTAGGELSLGDIDGDGDLDLLIGDSNQIRIEWYENITSNSIFYLPEELYICNDIFEELCGPLSSTCNTYSYNWYYNDPITQTSYPVTNSNPNDQCYTPDQYGDYTLVVEDEDGVFSRYNTAIIEVLPEPFFIHESEICVGELISIADQGFDHCDYEITWYHNNTIVQQGGVDLLSSYLSGTITVRISHNNCDGFVSASISIVECCPTDLELAINCETGELYVENLPNDISINTIFWNFNNELIPNATDTTLQVTEAGIYSFGIIFTLSNGEECHHFMHFEYSEDYCCELIGLNPVASILNSDFTYPIEETPYGPMDIPIVVCGLELDGSLSTCEDSYHIMIEPYNPVDWTSAGAVIYDEWYSGQAPNSITIPSGTFPPISSGQFYLLTFAVGPTYTPTYIAFWYTCPGDKDGRRNNNTNFTNEDVILFPNPTTNLVNLKTSFDSGAYKIYDIQGKMISNGDLNSTNTIADLSKFNTGVYFIQIQSNNGEIHVRKLIKE